MDFPELLSKALDDGILDYYDIAEWCSVVGSRVTDEDVKQWIEGTAKPARWMKSSLIRKIKEGRRKQGERATLFFVIDPDHHYVDMAEYKDKHFDLPIAICGTQEEAEDIKSYGHKVAEVTHTKSAAEKITSLLQQE